MRTDYDNSGSILLPARWAHSARLMGELQCSAVILLSEYPTRFIHKNR